MRTVLRACVAALLMACAVVSVAQVPAPLAVPNIGVYNRGVVHALVRYPDGSMVIGGAFTVVNGTPRLNIARLLADGTVDPAWNAPANATVYTLAIDGGGNVYAGGNFTSIGGIARDRVAKLSLGGTVDATWNPSANATVRSLAVDGSVVYAGGLFTNIGGLDRNCIAKLSASGTGAADVPWNPNAGGTVTSVVVDASGDVYAGGDFTLIGGLPRGFIAKVSGIGAGAIDPSWNPAANNFVATLALDGGGNLYAGGAFTSISNVGRNRIAKLSTSGIGAVDATWNPSANGVVWSLAVAGSGPVYAGGDFSGIGGQGLLRVAKLSPSDTGAAEAGWTPHADGPVYALSTDASGTVAIGGNYGGISTSSCCAIVVMNAAGNVTMTAAAVSTGTVLALAKQPNGGIIVGGDFEVAGTTFRDNIFRLRPDGTLDPDWNPDANTAVRALAVDSQGDVYAGGIFSMIGNANRVFLAKLQGGGNGDAVLSWNTRPNCCVNAVAVDDNGNVYAGGTFSIINSLHNRQRIAKFSSSGALELGWDPGANNVVYALAIDGNGQVYAGGDFTIIGGVARFRIAKLSSVDGSADATWNPQALAYVKGIAIDAAGDVYAGGNFTTIGGLNRNYLAKLSGGGSGAVDPEWHPNLSSGSSVIALDGLGGLYVGGGFATVGGQDTPNLARVSTTGTGAVDTTWAPKPNGVVGAIALKDGNIYAGGGYTNIGGQDRISLAALPREQALLVDGFE